MKKVLSVAAVLLMLPVGAFACDPVSVGTYDMAINYDGVGDLDIRTSSFVHVSGSELTLAEDNSNWGATLIILKFFAFLKVELGAELRGMNFIISLIVLPRKLILK